MRVSRIVPPRPDDRPETLRSTLGYTHRDHQGRRRIAMRARLRDVVFLLVVLGGAGSLAAGLLRPLRREPSRPSRPIVARVGSRTDRRPGRRDVPSTVDRAGTGPGLAGRRAGRDAAAVAGALRARSLRWRRSAGSRPGRRAGGSTPGSTTCCATAAAPTTWPSGSPGPSSAPRTVRSCCSAAAGSSPGSATRSWRTAPTTRSSAT